MTVRTGPVRPAAVAAAHPCPVTTCTALCSTGHAVCRSHWLGIPKADRAVLADAFRNRLTDPTRFAEAVALTADLANHYARPDHNSQETA